MSGAAPQPPAPPNQPGSPAHARTISWSASFARIVLCLLVLLIASFIAMIVLPAVWSNPTSSQNTAEQNVDFAFFTILGGFLGVIAGKLT